MKRSIFVAIVGTLTCVGFFAKSVDTFGQQSPEGTGGARPLVIPTRPPTPIPGEICDAYLFSHIQIHRTWNGRYRDVYGHDVWEGYVDVAKFNGSELPVFVPNQQWSINDPDERRRQLAEIANSGEKPLYQPQSLVPPVLKTKLDDWFNWRIKDFFEREWDPNNPNNITQATDVRLNWYFWAFMYSLNPDSFVDGVLGRYFHVGEDHQIHPRNREVIEILGVSSISRNFADHFYFDALGNLLADKPVGAAKICDAGVWYSMGCPLSLVLRRDHDINADVRIVNFPIDPARQGQSFLWKASAEAPLLVYDPQHSGKITSAQQLFGHFTFGGKRTAALNDSSPGGLPGLWQDGFDALSSLDSDQSGAVEGSELEPLALWSDANRDGISDPGEVVPVTSSGVSKLFYKVERSQAPGRDISLDVGFERTVDGKVETGKSVDWYSTSASSPGALLTKVSELSYGERSRSGLESTRTEAPASDTSDSTTAAVAKNTKLVGGWKWQLQGEPANGPYGYIVIQTNEKGELIGTNFAIQPAPSDLMAPAAAVVQMSSISFKSADKSSASFVVYTPGNSSISSDVRVSADGKTMQGTSAARSKVAGGPTVIHYRWTATRIAG